jgi:hypothetical protein
VPHSLLIQAGVAITLLLGPPYCGYRPVRRSYRWAATRPVLWMRAGIGPLIRRVRRRKA